MCKTGNVAGKLNTGGGRWNGEFWKGMAGWDHEPGALCNFLLQAPLLRMASCFVLLTFLYSEEAVSFTVDLRRSCFPPSLTRSPCCTSLLDSAWLIFHFGKMFSLAVELEQGYTVRSCADHFPFAHQLPHWFGGTDDIVQNEPDQLLVTANVFWLFHALSSLAIQREPLCALWMGQYSNSPCEILKRHS